jgi:hypothetical protein
MKSLKSYILILLLFVALPVFVKAQTTNHQVYALFVVNMAKYSSWPNHTGGEMHITVLGKTKVYDELSKLNGKNANGIVKVDQVDDVNAVGNPNIIYLADGKSSALDDLLKVLQGRPVMIVTEREGLFKKGAGFSFIIMENSTLRFDINNSDLEKRQIKVSRSLAALANSAI